MLAAVTSWQPRQVLYNIIPLSRAVRRHRLKSNDRSADEFFFCGTAVERWTHPSAARDGFSQYYWTESQKYFPADLTHRFHENRLKKYFFISVQIYHFFLNRQLLLGFQKLALHYVRLFNTHKGCAQCWLSSSYVKMMYLLVKTKRTSKNDKLFVLVQKIYSNNKPQNYQLTPHRIVFLRAMIYHCFQT